MPLLRSTDKPVTLNLAVSDVLVVRAQAVSTAQVFSVDDSAMLAVVSGQDREFGPYDSTRNIAITCTAGAVSFDIPASARPSGLEKSTSPLSGVEAASRESMAALANSGWASEAEFRATLTDAAAGAGDANIKLKSAAAIPLAATISIPTGNGVSIEGGGAVFDLRTLTGGDAENPIDSVRLTSISSTFPIPGQDTGSTNYWGKRGSVSNLGFIGPGPSSFINGLVSDNLGGPETRQQRPTMRDIVVSDFRAGLTLRNRSCFDRFDELQVKNCAYGLVLEGGEDQGENSVIDHPVFANGGIGVLIKAGTDNVQCDLRGPSIDYNEQYLKWESGYGDLVLSNGNYETRVAEASDPTRYAFDLGAGSGSRSKLTLSGGTSYIVCASGTPVWQGVFDIGNNMTVRLEGGTRLQNLANASGGYVYGVGKGSAGADVRISALARCTGTGELIVADPLVFGTTPMLPSITAPTSRCSMLADPSFEKVDLVDGWVDASSVPGATIGTIATTSADSLVGSRCLAIPHIGGAGVNRFVNVYIPIDKAKKGTDRFRVGYTFGVKFGGAPTGSGAFQLFWARGVLAPPRATLRSTSRAAQSLATLQAVTGTLTIVVDGATFSAADVAGLATAASFDDAAAVLAKALNLRNGVSLTYDTAKTQFVVRSGKIGALGSVAVATGTAASGLGLSAGYVMTEREWTQYEISGASITPDKTITPQTYWQMIGLNVDQDRISFPDETTHLVARFNLGGINNAGQSTYFDTAYFTPF